MIAWLIPIVVRSGVPQRFARVAAWALALLVVVALCWAAVAAFRSWITEGKEEAISVNQKDVTIEAANLVINATSAATSNQMARDDAFAEDQKELQNVVDTKGTDDRAGPATVGVLQRLREQQAAGRRGPGASR